MITFIELINKFLSTLVLLCFIIMTETFCIETISSFSIFIHRTMKFLCRMKKILSVLGWSEKISLDLLSKLWSL